jgi:hypothetical protein
MKSGAGFGGRPVAAAPFTELSVGPNCTGGWRHTVRTFHRSAGDIVISSRPIAPSENIIKRVTATEGQEVRVYKRGELAPLIIKVCFAVACRVLLGCLLPTANT